MVLVSDMIGTVPCTLSSYDVFKCGQHASNIIAGKHARGIHDQRYCKRMTEFESDYYGVQGELVVSRKLKVPMDLTIYAGGDNGIDLEYHDLTVQVKANTYTGADGLRFFFDTLADFKADIMVGVRIDSFVRCEIMGWITKEDFVDCHHVHNFGYGDRVCCWPSELKSIKTLIAEYGEPG